MSPHIVLASSSAGRRELLSRLQIPFSAVSPDVDETAYDNEPPPALAERLARAKAEAVAAEYPQSIVIGSDQVADVDGTAVGKPGSLDAARQQLRAQSGRLVLFHTSVAVAAPDLSESRVALETVKTTFRPLTDAQIEAYIQAEDPTQTAGTLKSEGLGITLLAAVESSDPSTLIGLPLIQLTDLLSERGISLPS
ncbi:septum formation protein Maf [Salinisphaera sp. USBA-960]|uniref:Maf family protein n=1 Tax=Salinisphaera orenii TaxID=856731 RepID=UPI000DBE067C|nr:septum formation protein Maf [Salifodinibacter halophilus]NNC25912.1 septum formation protein Maf [Salifodinibacter halophilus]